MFQMIWIIIICKNHSEFYLVCIIIFHEFYGYIYIYVQGYLSQLKQGKAPFGSTFKEMKRNALGKESSPTRRTTDALLLATLMGRLKVFGLERAQWAFLWEREWASYYFFDPHRPERFHGTEPTFSQDLILLSRLHWGPPLQVWVSSM